MITPGPWYPERGRHPNHWTVRADYEEGNHKITFQLCEMRGNREDAEDNARAIAAVPDMLELLREFAVLVLPHFDEKFVFEKQVSLGFRAAEILRQIEGGNKNNGGQLGN